ncbi:MAG: asparaginase, partial [Candidatus Dormibacteria bacterium]
PIQAIPLVESGAADAFGLTPQEIAVACGSHSGEQVHVDAVREMLGRAGLRPEDLRNGPPESPGEERLRQNCSGNHAGLMIAARHLGLDVPSYVKSDHPLQVTIRGLHAQLAGIDVNEVTVGIDGCSVPAFALSLEEMARAYGRFADPAYAESSGGARGEAIARLSGVMMAQPLMVAGTNSEDTDLMGAAPGQVCCKVGAESVWCFGFPGRGGAAIKVEDGAARPRSVIAVEMLRQAELLPAPAVDAYAARHVTPTVDARGQVTGQMRPAFRLRVPGPAGLSAPRRR